MKKLNNKGFTLIEVLAVVVIIAVLGLIAIPSVLNTISTSIQASYDILVENITIGSKQLFEEIDFIGSTLYHYDLTGRIEDKKIEVFDNKITVNLQTLVSNGFLTGSNNPDKSGGNNNNKIITNPKTAEDIGVCEITITKIVDADFNTSYQINNNSTSNTNCPIDEEYEKALGKQEGE